MWRYIKEAFWARISVPLVGGLPINALVVSGFGILGFAEHGFWLLGLGLETGYLYALATNVRFQGVIIAREYERTLQTSERDRRDLVTQVSPEGRARLEQMNGKLKTISNLYRTNGSDNLLLDSSMEALQQLAALHLRLLVTEGRLQMANKEVDAAALSRQEAALARELATGGEALSVSLRESKQATLELVRKRVVNARRRGANLAQIASDLSRIEVQVDLALEGAGLEGKPAVVTSNLNLLNQILASNDALGTVEISSNDSNFTSEPRTADSRTEQTGQI